MEDREAGSATRRVSDDVAPDAESIFTALQEILDSPEFEGAGRVQAFLSYVVQEELSGRGDRIRGKTILDDVYGRSPLEGRDPMAVVRVDGGRLRRRLTDYYAGSGKDSCLRILVNPGSYNPTFQSFQAVSSDQTLPPTTADSPRKPHVSSAILAPLGAGLMVVLVGLAFIVSQDRSTSEQADAQAASTLQDDQISRAVREALFSASPAKLQAANLAGRARSLLFPALERPWLELVLQMFDLTIEMDETYFGGYAGVAQAEVLIAIALPMGDERERRILNSSQSASKALELGIDQSWSHSAMALVAMVRRDYTMAREESARAIALDPDDADALNIDALIALFSGDFDRSLEMADLVDAMSGPNDNFPIQSVRASAHFHRGDYRNALRLFNKATLEGSPISPISLGYMGAAHARLGEHDQATDMLDLLESAWPGFPIDALFRSLYRDPAHASEVIDALNEAGRLTGTPASAQ